MQFRNALFLCKKTSHMFKYFCADVLKYFLHIFQNKNGLRGPVVHNRTFPVPLTFLQRSSGTTATPSHPSSRCSQLATTDFVPEQQEAC